MLCGCNVISCSSYKQYYYYINRVGSITRSISENSIKMWEYGMDQLLAYSLKNEPQDYLYLEGRFDTCIFWDVIDRMLMSREYIEISKRLRKKYISHLWKAWRLPILTKKGKLKVYLFLANLRFYRKVRIKWIKRKNNANERIFLESI